MPFVETIKQELKQNIVLSAISLALVLGLAECAARIYVVHIADGAQFKMYASMAQIQAQTQKKKVARIAAKSPINKNARHRFMGAIPTPNYRYGKNKHNSLGYRGDEITQPKPAGEFRIVCLGGSTTYTGRVLDYRKSYPYLLEKELKDRGFENVTVVNAGKPGRSSLETMINFQLRVLDLEPDLVIVYHGINDLNRRLVWPPEAYRADNSGVRVASGLSKPYFFERSTLLRILAIRAGLILPQASLSRFLGPTRPTYYAKDFARQKRRGTYPSGIFKEVSAEKMLATNKPTHFRRNITNIAASAKAHGAEVILATFAYTPVFEDKPRAASKEYISAFKEMEVVLKEIAQKMDVHFFDFASKFPSEKQYYEDEWHVNEEGAQLKAELFADFIKRNNLIE